MTGRPAWLPIAGLWLALGFAPLAPFGPVAARAACPQGHGPFGTTLLTPDRAHTVCIADATTPGKYELYSAPTAGGPAVRLSPDMPTGGAVQSPFQILGGGLVRYSANLDGGGNFVWYVAPDTGGITLLDVFRDDFEAGSAAAWR